MAYPTCAPAPLPTNPDAFELTMQAIREIKGARAAYQVIDCIQSIADASEARELMRVTDAEFQRRVQCALATLRSMRRPPPPSPPVGIPGRI